MLALLLCCAAVQDQQTTFDGVVKSVDAKKHEVTIKRTNGKETTVKIVKDTNVRYDKAKSSFDKIKKGQEVRCEIWLDNKEATFFAIYDTTDRPPLKP